MIGTTDVDLSEDLMDTFSFTIDFPLPTSVQRSALIQTLLKERELELQDQVVQDLVNVIDNNFKIRNQEG
jgi:hypothetical protein